MGGVSVVGKGRLRRAGMIHVVGKDWLKKGGDGSCGKETFIKGRADYALTDICTVQAHINVLEIKLRLMTCYIKPCILIMTTHSKMNMLALVMIIYLVYEHDCYSKHYQNVADNI
jgi:hypothetical protein